jgi:hypothetical protein
MKVRRGAYDAFVMWDPQTTILDLQHLFGLVENLLGLGMIAGLVQLFAPLAQIHDFLLVRGRELSRLQGLINSGHVLRTMAGKGRPNERGCERQECGNTNGAKHDVSLSGCAPVGHGKRRVINPQSFYSGRASLDCHGFA